MSASNLQGFTKIFEKTKGLETLSSLPEKLLTKVEDAINYFQNITLNKNFMATLDHKNVIGLDPSFCNKPFFAYVADVFVSMPRMMTRADANKDRLTKLQLLDRQCLQNMLIQFKQSDGDFWPADQLHFKLDKKKYTLEETQDLAAVIVETLPRSTWLQSATKKQQHFFCMLADTGEPPPALKNYQKLVLKL